MNARPKKELEYQVLEKSALAQNIGPDSLVKKNGPQIVEISPTIKRIAVLIIKPTKYNKRGYPITFQWAVLPSNTLAVMNGMVHHAAKDPMFEGIKIALECFDEIVWSKIMSPGKINKLVNKYDDGHTKIIVLMSGVQTNQFPRARDIAEKFIVHDCVEVAIGGFHVSGQVETVLFSIEDKQRDRKHGYIPRLNYLPADIHDLMNKGIVVFSGECEELLPQLLADMASGSHYLMYRAQKPDIYDAPLPIYPKEYFKGFAVDIETNDANRGCPLACDFCCIINVQGRDPRARKPKAIVTRIKQICEEKGYARLFFADDNFGRSKLVWDLLDKLIELKKQGYDFAFNVQTDLKSGDITRPKNHPNYREGSCNTYPEALGLAGCERVFLGMESLDKRNVKAAGKTQNKPEDYAKLITRFHKNGISTHAAYIIGFPYDTPESVKKYIEKLKEIEVDHVSFYILGPIPGSELFVRLLHSGDWYDSDWNKFDSFEPVMAHPNAANDGIPQMSTEEWQKTYDNAWREFYRSAQIIAAINRAPDSDYWGSFKNFLWYRNSALNHKIHPMICGFIPTEDRTDRRPGMPTESILTFYTKVAIRVIIYTGLFLKEFYIFQHIYFQTRLARERREDAATLARKLSQPLRGFGDWFARTFKMPPTRVWLNNFWIKYGSQRWRLLYHPFGWTWHLKMIPYCLTEILFTVRFGRDLYKNMKAMRAIKHTA